MTFRKFCEVNRKTSRLSLLSMAHDHHRLAERLAVADPELWAKLKADIDAEDEREDIPMEDLPKHGRPLIEPREGEGQ